MTNRLSDTVMTAEGPIPKVQKFTNKLLDNLPQPLPGKDYYLVDETIFTTKPYKPYFQLRVTSRGKKFKIVFTSISERTGRKQTDKKDFPNCDGSYPRMSVDIARQQVRKLYKDINDPKTPDPWADRKALKLKNGEPTLWTLLREYILAGKANKSISSPKTEIQYESRINAHFKQFKDRPFSELNNRTTLIELTEYAIANDNRMFDKAMGLLSDITDFSSLKYVDENENPTYSNLARPIRKRYLKGLKYGANKDSLDGKPDFDRFFKLLESDELKEFEKEFLLFTLLTGYRSGILFRGLSWNALNLDKSTYTLIPKNRPHDHQGTEMPLPRYLNAILRQREGMQAKHQRVFPITEARINKLLKTAMGERKTGRGFTLKHLRKTFVTFAEALEIDPPIIAALVNHKWGENVVTDIHYKDWEAVQKLREEWGHGDTRLSDALETIVSKMLEYMPDYSPDDGTKVVRIKAASK